MVAGSHAGCFWNRAQRRGAAAQDGASHPTAGDPQPRSLVVGAESANGAAMTAGEVRCWRSVPSPWALCFSLTAGPVLVRCNLSSTDALVQLRHVREPKLELLQNENALPCPSSECEVEVTPLSPVEPLHALCERGALMGARRWSASPHVGDDWDLRAPRRRLEMAPRK
ncbi:hypothetical protein EJ04DRAFT_517849 [Polyplosphaeria fusca]|uniref:Uncharacterized protein n=1 Tax=Polyplosphaeria fusca TaxID=682080 RepID=A0A9P4R8Q1_9PLEO|nr:hypothetical protein EJ04DRAFT_517849 [Polyplosphaeria fusca]